MKFKLHVNSARQYKDLWNMSDDKPFLCTAPGCGQIRPQHQQDS
ncbi:ATF2 isoform 17 [Pan troglodytes]|uniref:Activating transcription factor 2 n=3 Tax=Hominidae TaxID=9604 RepID=F2Z2K2_HUMAN|nr:ATF2 isoform 11 [Pan troglodytes]PNJ60019.1 ATF2 isoform 10 [Pongo abelii]PNI86517.1 ATF2 isoform 12 [Pan troglodytes]PNI86521.1 ATF2 isoform 17 [Pan troglodytes]PNJ60021.1 ATF2 isoform 12 [Pongo abelii]